MIFNDICKRYYLLIYPNITDSLHNYRNPVCFFLAWLRLGKFHHSKLFYPCLFCMLCNLYPKQVYFYLRWKFGTQLLSEPFHQLDVLRASPLDYRGNFPNVKSPLRFYILLWAANVLLLALVCRSPQSFLGVLGFEDPRYRAT